MSIRVYLPTTRAGLAALVAGEGWEELSVGVEPVVAEGDSEDEEYAALMTAADASTALYDATGEAGRRRVVVVADVPSAKAGVTLDVVASVHLDTEDRDADADPDDDLAWFVPDELAQLL